jgi:Coenzyme PQQ synthesis protein D (PqqD)
LKGIVALTDLGPHSRVGRISGIAWRLVEGEAILVNAKRDEVIHLDPVGSFIWSKMEGDTTLQEIAQDLTEEFEVDLETAVQDSIEFAGDLLERGAAEIVDLGQ